MYAAHCTCHCRNSIFFYIHNQYIWSMKYLGLREVVRFKDINQTHWCDAGHDFAIFKIDRLKMWILRSYYDFACECECIRVCLRVCWICFVYSLCSIKDSMLSLSQQQSSAVDLFLIYTKCICEWIAKGLLVSYASLWLCTTVCANCFRKLIKILSKKVSFLLSQSDIGLCAHQFLFVPNCCTLVMFGILKRNCNIHKLIHIHMLYAAKTIETIN